MTDSQAFHYVCRKQNALDLISNWLCLLSEFKVTISFKPGDSSRTENSLLRFESQKPMRIEKHNKRKIYTSGSQFGTTYKFLRLGQRNKTENTSIVGKIFRFTEKPSLNLNSHPLKQMSLSSDTAGSNYRRQKHLQNSTFDWKEPNSECFSSMNFLICINQNSIYFATDCFGISWKKELKFICFSAWVTYNQRKSNQGEILLRNTLKVNGFDNNTTCFLSQYGLRLVRTVFNKFDSAPPMKLHNAVFSIQARLFFSLA